LYNKKIGVAMNEISTILGEFEIVEFPQYEVANLVAKIDTGADTGALHCTNVREEITPKGKFLHFSPFDHPEVTETTTMYKARLVRSSNGTVVRRYYIDTIIRIQGRDYEIHLSLADREKMQYQVLIGKRFLKAHKLLVDVSRNSQ
jgi:hypothetical protein